MRAQRVVSHELRGDSLCEGGIESAADIDGGELTMFALVVCLELQALAFDVGIFGVGLRIDGRKQK